MREKVIRFASLANRAYEGASLCHVSVICSNAKIAEQDSKQSHADCIFLSTMCMCGQAEASAEPATAAAAAAPAESWRIEDYLSAEDPVDLSELHGHKLHFASGGANSMTRNEQADDYVVSHATC